MGTADLRIELLRPKLVDDYLRFFDHERGVAFADNPQWAKCYCHYYHVPKNMDWQAFDGPANRVAMASRIEVGEMEGYLAYAGDDVVGWMNAQPLHKLPHCWARLEVPRPVSPLPLSMLAAIVCFVIAPASRRRGVARALLRGGLESLGRRGIGEVYAYPFKTEGTDAPTAHYHGPEALFRAAGFVAIDATPDVTIMRRTLRAA